MRMSVTIIIIAALIILAGCAGQISKRAEKSSTLTDGSRTAGKYEKITPREAKNILDTEKGIVLLDVRTQEEYNDGHIPGSILLPVDDIEKKAEMLLKDKNSKILVYCRSGRRSAIASEKLAGMGYGNVYDFGGINDWPYKTEK